MDMESLLTLCRKYRDLGNAVADQLDSVVAGHDVTEQNQNALDLISRTFLVDIGRLTDDEDLIEEAGELMEEFAAARETDEAQQVCCGEKGCHHGCSEEDRCSACAGRGDCTYPAEGR
jgi:hypothetical protein